jgi:hypothetical protein
MVIVLGREALAPPDWLAPVGLVGRPVAGRLHEPQVLGVGHGVEAQIVGRQGYQKGLATTFVRAFVAREELPGGDEDEEGAVGWVLEEEPTLIRQGGKEDFEMASAGDLGGLDHRSLASSETSVPLTPTLSHQGRGEAKEVSPTPGRGRNDGVCRALGRGSSKGRSPTNGREG